MNTGLNANHAIGGREEEPDSFAHGPPYEQTIGHESNASQRLRDLIPDDYHLPLGHCPIHDEEQIVNGAYGSILLLNAGCPI